MKGIKWLTLVLTLCLLLTAGCGSGKAGSEEERALLSQVKLPSGAKKLSASALDKAEAWFNAAPIRKQFLQTTYAAPETIDLGKAFYLGDGDTRAAEADEIRAFLAQYGWWGSFMVSSVTADEMDALLRQYADISLAQTQMIGLDGLYHVEALNRYYSLHGDIADKPFEALYGYQSGDTLCLYYSGSVRVLTRMTGIFRVTLRSDGDGYVFLSNEFCDSNGSFITYRTETPAPTADAPEMEETVELRALQELPALSAATPEEATRLIEAQADFESVQVTGLGWNDISEYGEVIAGISGEKTVIYYVRADGTVFELPVFLTGVEPSGLLFGGGEWTFEYMMERSEGVPGGSVTDWYGTLFLPTSELFVRTVRGTLPGE